jgi:exopolysaccharide biosynthesis polyprenyl glycosylphosphotransferase
MLKNSIYTTRQIPDEGWASRITFPYDVRLRRELAHRRLVVSMARRLLRIVSLHLLDATLLTGVVLLLAGLWSSNDVRELTPAIVAVFLVSLNAVSAYDSGNARRDRWRLLLGSGLGVFIVACVTFFPPHVALSVVHLLLIAAASFVALAIGRTIADQLVRQAYVHGIGLRRAVVVGNLAEVSEAIEQLRDERNIDQYIVGHLAPEHEPDPAALGVLSDLMKVLDDVDVQEVVLATSLPPQTVRWVAECCFERGTLLYVFPSVLATFGCRAELQQVGGCALLYLSPSRLEVPALFVKRIFDLVVASLALVVAIPAMLLIALAIKLDSRGPVFFRQERVGLGGRRFTMWKFRSMCIDSERQQEDLAPLNSYRDARLFKLREDPRITRVGHLLRRSSMDELPQLFNVLLSDMSLVGPRPPLPCEVDQYEPHHFERLSVVPGITGPWQVGGRNLVTDFEKVVRMERAYIRSWSLLLDAKILVRTVKVVVRGEGAY